jgi:hypothetical protein
MCGRTSHRPHAHPAPRRRWCVHGGSEYVVTVVPLEIPGPRGEQSRIKVLRTIVGSDDWEELPMQLTYWSRFAKSIFTNWPPEDIDRVSCEQGRLILRYRDRWVPYEKPIMPFGLDRESLWEGEYIARKRAWKLRRVQRLDYESGDESPPVLEEGKP